MAVDSTTAPSTANANRQTPHPEIQLEMWGARETTNNAAPDRKRKNRSKPPMFPTNTPAKNDTSLLDCIDQAALYKYSSDALPFFERRVTANNTDPTFPNLDQLSTII
jgi:hypothetical protein